MLAQSLSSDSVFTWGSVPYDMAIRTLGHGASCPGSNPSSASGTLGQPLCPPVPEFLHLLLGVILGLTEQHTGCVHCPAATVSGPLSMTHSGTAWGSIKCMWPVSPAVPALAAFVNLRRPKALGMVLDNPIPRTPTRAAHPWIHPSVQMSVIVSCL